MQSVAVIAEYNPFHTGHAHHLASIRRDFGDDVAVIAVMSGNYTQRGALAIADKRTRAECAVRCGVDLVLELPFPFSLSSAECFARSGVAIADAIGASVLSFGSECGDMAQLTAAADILSSPAYLNALREAARRAENKSIGHAALAERVFRSSASGTTDNLFTPNNILAMEYIRAIRARGAALRPHTIERRGASYRAEGLTDDSYQSATALRRLLSDDPGAATPYLPSPVRETLDRAMQRGDFPLSEERLDIARIASLRINPTPTPDIPDAADGLYNRLRTLSMRANDITALTALAETKKFTRARIRRVLWYSYLGVTSSDVAAEPLYTQILAMNNRGKAYLRSRSGKTGIPILTKPSRDAELTEAAKRQKALADRADAVADLARPVPKSGVSALTLTPFIL